ncbi:serine/threonine-protein phosphatase [Streptomyces triticagri]|uniref:Serine/threonine-protein phosphatase n=1 Tax=Streptomyces triticagri TaxID=2293568 RepID=A0A372M9L3_9ACTN|nr:PP2C family protein-serine/threonine phosphatase [Streptomyces triticagri]RFU87581.1 serine/threonine-protein phosphatase [Streptomyces triticagri]
MLDLAGRPGAPRLRHPRRSDLIAARAARIVRLLPLPLILAGAAFYVFTPAGFTSPPFFETAPLLIAPLYSLRGTVAVAALALAVQIALELANGTADDPTAITEMVTQFLVGGIAVALHLIVARHGRRLATARGMAETVQRAVLPPPPQRTGTLDVAARYEAAEADALIGGDLYAVQETPYGVRVLVGDVRGKGMQAVRAVATTIGVFREAAEQQADLAAVADRLDLAVQRGTRLAEGPAVSEGFVTAVLAELDQDRNLLRVVNRGHPGPLLLTPVENVDTPDGRPVRVRTVEPDVPALPLGMGDLGSEPTESVEVAFPPGTTLLAFTDGLSEARDRDGAFFDPVTALRNHSFTTPDRLLDTLLDAVHRHTNGRQADDMALLAVTRTDGTSAGRP